MYSEYYQKNFTFTEEEKDILLDIYEEIAKEQGFDCDYENRNMVNFKSDSGLINTVLYHVENFGKEKNGYDIIAFLFE